MTFSTFLSLALLVVPALPAFVWALRWLHRTLINALVRVVDDIDTLDTVKAGGSVDCHCIAFDDAFWVQLRRQVRICDCRWLACVLRHGGGGNSWAYPQAQESCRQ